MSKEFAETSRQLHSGIFLLSDSKTEECKTKQTKLELPPCGCMPPCTNQVAISKTPTHAQAHKHAVLY